MDRLSLKYNDVVVRMACCVTSLEDFHLRAYEVLSQHELEKYGSFKFEFGKVEYLLGRYSAKRAYLKLTNKHVNYSEIDIRNGIFEQPYFADDANFDVSISHSRSVGGALVFDRAFPMGFDLEVIDRERLKTIRLSVSDEELEHLYGDYENNITAIWCMKEALSKSLKTGLTIPYEMLCLTELTKDSEDVFTCKFKDFTQYNGIAKIFDGIVIAISYPMQLQIFMRRENVCKSGI